MDSSSDLELIRLLASDSPDVSRRAFETLFRRHQRRAFDVAYRVLGDSSLASDAVQEAFLSVYRKGARFEARARFSSWLHRVVLNRAIDLQRRERRHRAASLSAAEGGDDGDAGVPEPIGRVRDDPAVAAVGAERARLVGDAIARLSPKLAEIATMRYPEGRSYEEIGEILGLPPGTVKSRLNRAHAALRAILGETLDEPDGPAATES